MRLAYGGDRRRVNDESPAFAEHRVASAWPTSDSGLVTTGPDGWVLTPAGRALCPLLAGRDGWARRWIT